MGQIGALSGDRVLAPFGQNLMRTADQEAETLGSQAERQQQLSQQRDFQTGQLAHMGAEETQAKSALAETVRQHNLENQQKQWEYGIKSDGAPDDQYQKLVDAIGTYNMAPLSSMSTRNPRNLNIMSDVYAKYPDFDSTAYANKLSSVKAFGGGGKQGQTLRSADVGIQHLGVLSNAIDALNNAPIPVWNRVANSVKQELGLSTAPTDFAAIKPIVADEINKFIIGAGGGVTDREQMQAAINAAQTPQALHSVVNHWIQLMGGQIHGLKQEYESNTRLSDFDQKLSKATRVALGMESTGPQGRSAAPGAGQRVRVDAQGNILGN